MGVGQDGEESLAAALGRGLGADRLRSRRQYQADIEEQVGYLARLHHLASVQPTEVLVDDCKRFYDRWVGDLLRHVTAGPFKLLVSCSERHPSGPDDQTFCSLAFSARSFLRSLPDCCR